MSWKICRLGVLEKLGVAALLLVGTAAAPAANSKTAPLPKFTRVQEVYRQHFHEKLPDYRSGEVLSRGQVEPLFRSLEAIGWRVAARGAILEAVLPDNEPLVRHLRTPAGKRFARQLSTVPEGYDRLYHLSRLPAGLKRVDNLIQERDGYLLIKYMTTTKEGRRMAKMLSHYPGGKDFTKPTGRIYTDKMLLDRLKEEYTKAGGTVVESPKKTERR